MKCGGNYIYSTEHVDVNLLRSKYLVTENLMCDPRLLGRVNDDVKMSSDGDMTL